MTKDTYNNHEYKTKCSTLVAFESAVKHCALERNYAKCGMPKCNNCDIHSQLVEMKKELQSYFRA